MLFQFKVVADDSIWIVDTQYLQFGRVSAPPNPQQPEESKVLESGKLVPKGFGVYGFDGRRPDQGNGLATIGTYVVGIGATVKIYLRANVEVKDFTMPVPIRQGLYEILPSDPKQVEQSIQEMTDVEGSEVTEPQGPPQSEVSRELPETTAGTEQPEAGAGVGPGNTELGAGTDSEG